MYTTGLKPRSGNIYFIDFSPKSGFKVTLPSKNSRGGKFVRVTYGPKKLPLKLQTPTVSLPFGVSTYKDESTGVSSESLDMSLRGYDDASNGPMQALFKVLQAIDEKILQAAEANSEAYFGKKMSRELLAEFQRTVLKWSRNTEKNWPPTFKVKVAKDYSGQMPQVYDAADKTTVHDASYIVKGSTAKLIFTFNSMYIISKTFGLSSRLVQAVVLSRPLADEGCMFIDDGDELEVDAEATEPCDM
ncbi:hypothetical protein OEZ85_002350 [Tetradesmus obliquus]|uniref:Plastid lipid-associated protein/fibrillin conserved domain-containing protein n=1 Tax=Tetradesmus obliquus TaxID=3088 RepID=A0ABY8U2Q0_TETOB|nr:hypothetical protein OEZ85_002350 [Tetradesmus obliquus]